MADIKFEIVEHIATLGTHAGGWFKELNLVSWNDGEPKYEIRDWSPDHTKCGKGSPMTYDEYKALAEVLADMLHDGELE